MCTWTLHLLYIGSHAYEYIGHETVNCLGFWGRRSEHCRRCGNQPTETFIYRQRIGPPAASAEQIVLSEVDARWLAWQSSKISCVICVVKYIYTSKTHLVCPEAYLAGFKKHWYDQDYIVNDKVQWKKPTGWMTFGHIWQWRWKHWWMMVISQLSTSRAQTQNVNKKKACFRHFCVSLINGSCQNPTISYLYIPSKTIYRKFVHFHF